MPKFTPKYKLHILFDDDSEWDANDEDVSETDPTKSSFYDLMQIKKPILAAVINDDKGHGLGINLQTGEFHLNGNTFQVDENPLPPMQRDLIFFRQHQHDTSTKYEQDTGKIKSVKETDHRVKYFLGWKVNIGGKNYQQVVGID